MLGSQFFHCRDDKGSNGNGHNSDRHIDLAAGDSEHDQQQYYALDAFVAAMAAGTLMSLTTIQQHERK